MSLQRTRPQLEACPACLPDHSNTRSATGTHSPSHATPCRTLAHPVTMAILLSRYSHDGRHGHRGHAQRKRQRCQALRIDPASPAARRSTAHAWVAAPFFCSLLAGTRSFGARGGTACWSSYMYAHVQESAGMLHVCACLVWFMVVSLYICISSDLTSLISMQS